MKIERLAIPDLLLIEPKRFGDERGFFSEVWSRRTLAAHGITADFVQDNHSLSRQKGVIRGLHFQKPPSAQAKLVRVVRGSILDIAVDIREGSATYGQHVACELSAANWQQLWIPAGFAHGFVTLEEDTEVLYKVDVYYDPKTDAAIAWNDPALAIDWAVSNPILSDKDSKAPLLADIPPPFPKGTW
ncbi:MAG: dTDP-4-dehydrorhamnose 3,5-epimerase [Alphaproteobacteria bacterium]